jgi:hypothetical protein
MKKFIVFFWVLIVVLCALSANSFADQQNNQQGNQQNDRQNNRPLVFRNQGAIQGLEFYFYPPGLRVDLTDIGLGTINVVYAAIETSGNELAIIYPGTKDYFCYGNYDSGNIYAYDADGNLTIISMVSASLDEHYTILDYEYRISHPFDHTFTEEIYTASLIFRAVLGSRGKHGKTVKFTMVVKNGEIIYAGTK